MLRFIFFFLIITVLSVRMSAQQQVTVISRCGGTETVTIPSIIDNDLDGMDDSLEQRLLDHFMPYIVQFTSENCPGPALDGSGDTNLIACHIYPVPQQYTRSSSYDSILIHPVALVPARGLVPGLIWYYPLVKVNTAVLYGQDCGLLGHTADVEGFSFSLKYIGPDTLAGWMYDTILSHWMGDTIQTISHAGTLCQQIETRAMKSLYISWGADSVYASPDKHGNYLTITGCGSSIICNPGCTGTQVIRHVRNVNLGEPNATLVTDMGNLYPAYTGNPPWQTANFLNSQGGNAGAIRDKMLIPLNSSFIHGHTLTQAQICPLYAYCYGPPAHAYSAQTCTGTPYQFHTRSLSQSGTYRDTIITGAGCDSIVTLTLSVLPIDTYALQASICSGSAYSFLGQQLSASGTYYHTLSDMHGCDSIVVLTLTTHDPSATSFSAVTCDSLYDFGGQVVTATGTYVHTLSNVSGCDSVVTLSLIIDSLPAPVWAGAAIDTILFHSHAILLSGTSPGGGVYTGTGVIGNVFYPDSVPAGTYVITYTYTDSLGCHSSVSHTIEVVLITDIQEPDLSHFTLSPVPSSDRLYLSIPISDMSMTICDMTGRVWTPPYTQTEIDIASLPAGVYSLRLQSRSGTVVRRFVKE